MTRTPITSFPAAGHKPNPLVRRALKLIETRACDGLTVKEIARELGISRLMLHREFLIRFSKTPAQMLKLTRMNAAKTLLATTDLPIKQVAHGGLCAGVEFLCHLSQAPGPVAQRVSVRERAWQGRAGHAKKKQVREK